MGALGPLKNSDIDELIGIGTAGQVPVLQSGGGLAYGEATIPSGGTLLAVRGDADTGLSSPSADVLAMTAGGVEAMRATESGGGVEMFLSDPSLKSNKQQGNAPPSASHYMYTNSVGGLVIMPPDGVNPSGDVFFVGDQYGTQLFSVSLNGIGFEGTLNSNATGHRFGGFGDKGGVTKYAVAFDSGGTNKAAIQVRQDVQTASTIPLIDGCTDFNSNTRSPTVSIFADLLNSTSGSNYETRVRHTVGDSVEPHREYIRAEADQTQVLMGFFGATAVAQQSLTYSRTGETTPESQLRAALANLGLVADNTTA